MKKKLISLLVIFMIICGCVGFQIAYADTINNKVAKSEILGSSSLEIEKNSSFNLSIDLNKITFEHFKIELSSNINLENPTLTDADKLETEVDFNKNLFEIKASKSDLNLETLTLAYKLPETVNVGDNIQFILKATSTEEGENADSTVIEDSITFTVVEKTNSENNNANDNNNGGVNHSPDNSNNSNNDFPADNNKTSGNVSTSSNMQNFSVELGSSSNNSSTKSSSQISGISTTSSLGSNSQAVVYDGSSNNYLSTLSVDGYSFDNEFSKTTSTYFITVPEDTTSLNINASTEDSTATLCVYGDTDLNSGTNKILVNVTAENGSVRTYRIYVTLK